MSDTWTIYRVLGAGADGQDIKLDFGIEAKHDELENYRKSGYEVHRRLYRQGKGGWIHWRGPWKLDTPSEEQKKVIKEAGPYGIELMVTAEEKGYKKGWVFIKLKDRYDSMIAGYVYGTIYAPWHHKCPKRKHDNESMVLDTNEKCRDCGAESEVDHGLIRAT